MTRLTPPTAIVFDLDGTLVDSHPEIAATLGAALADCGIAGIAPLLRAQIGPPIDQLLLGLIPNESEATRVAVRDAYVRRYDRLDHAMTLPFAGVREGIGRLRGRGIRTFIATAKRDFPTRRMVELLSLGRFDAIGCVDTVAGSKRSKSQVVGALVRDHDLAASSTWMLGDTASDLRAARDHGLVSIAATWGYGPIDSLRAEMADAYTGDFAAFLDLVAAVDTPPSDGA